MALIPAFSIAVSQDPSAIILTDTSTGSDGAVVSRNIYLYKTDNTLLTGSFSWSAGLSITINPLQKDYALNVRVDWVNAGGTPLYTVSQIYAFTQYGEQFYANLTRLQSSQPTIVNDNTFYPSKGNLRVELDSASQAISLMADIFSAQAAISRYQYWIQNQTFYF